MGHHIDVEVYQWVGDRVSVPTHQRFPDLAIFGSYQEKVYD